MTLPSTGPQSQPTGPTNLLAEQMRPPQDKLRFGVILIFLRVILVILTVVLLFLERFWCGVKNEPIPDKDGGEMATGLMQDEKQDT